jgi:hypothetical protein
VPRRGCQSSPGSRTDAGQVPRSGSLGQRYRPNHPTTHRCPHPWTARHLGRGRPRVGRATPRLLSGRRQAGGHHVDHDPLRGRPEHLPRWPAPCSRRSRTQALCARSLDHADERMCRQSKAHRGSRNHDGWSRRCLRLARFIGKFGNICFEGPVSRSSMGGFGPNDSSTTPAGPCLPSSACSSQPRRPPGPRWLVHPHLRPCGLLRQGRVIDRAPQWGGGPRSQLTRRYRMWEVRGE